MVGPLSILILWQAVVVMATDLLPGSLSNSMEGDLTLLPEVVGNYLLKKLVLLIGSILMGLVLSFGGGGAL